MIFKFINPFNSHFIVYNVKKRQKKVKFSNIKQVYLINTIEEIKEYLPDMYWKYDKPTMLYLQRHNDNLQLQPNAHTKNVEMTTTTVTDGFIPLTRKEFVYSIKTPPEMCANHFIHLNNASKYKITEL